MNQNWQEQMYTADVWRLCGDIDVDGDIDDGRASACYRSLQVVNEESRKLHIMCIAVSEHKTEQRKT